MQHRSCLAPRPRQPAVRRLDIRGAMLIEVLVAILIFSIGVLALVGLQAQMTHAQSSAKSRADATYLANELIGVMWSDTANLGSYDACDGYARCSEWQAKVANSLPKGAGSIDVVDATTGEVTITVRWTSPSDGDHQYVTTTFIRAAG